MAYEVLARKWRPQVFEDVVGQEHIIRTLRNAITSDRLAHAYLFSGARGVGKTTVARILAKAINCAEGEADVPCDSCHSCTGIVNGSSTDVQEIDGASNRGIDEIRELRANIKYMPASSRFRVYIIDEVHMLTLPAFNALLKTLEEPPPHVKFIFATTEPQKVPVTILSRCQKFDFKRISPGRIVEHLKKIGKKEGMEIGQSGLAIIAREADGSMRDAESLLDQVVAFAGPEVGDNDITDILGIIDRALLFETASAIIEGSPGKCIEYVDRVYNYGYDIKEFYRALMDHFRNLLISLIATNDDLLNIADVDREEVTSQAKRAGLERIQQSVNLFIAREEELRFSFHPRLILETILIKLCRLGEDLHFDELIQKIEALEKRFSSFSSPSDNPGVPRLSDPGVDWETEAKGDSETAPAPEEEKQGDWSGFLEYLSTKSSSMSNVLKEWHLLDLNGDTLEITGSENSFSSSYFDEKERLDKLIWFCKDFFKRDIRIKIRKNVQEKKDRVITPKKGGPDPVKNRGDELSPQVQQVLKIFQGRVIGEESGQPVQSGEKEESGNARR